MKDHIACVRSGYWDSKHNYGHLWSHFPQIKHKIWAHLQLNMALFASLIIHTFQFFLTETVFFSHNKSAGTLFRLVFSAKWMGPMYGNSFSWNAKIPSTWVSFHLNMIFSPTSWYSFICSTHYMNLILQVSSWTSHDYQVWCVCIWSSSCRAHYWTPCTYPG